MASLSSRTGNSGRQAGSSLLILGVHVSNDAYPNVRQKVSALLARSDTQEINLPLPMTLLFKRTRSRLQRITTLVRFAASFLIAHARVLFTYLRTPTPHSLYVPYPSAGVLWLLSWLPVSRRPTRVVADAFISLYDTVVEDRGLVRQGGLLAHLLLACERRAYRYADIVTTDTDLNACNLQKIFDLPREKVIAIPLSIDEDIYRPSPYSIHSGTCTILFIGTFVPLQGADVIAQAITLLRDDPVIKFRLVGYGQNAPRVESILTDSDAHNWTWEKAWLDSTALAEEIRAADICLGIFGTGAKTQRVWPLKNYSYMAVGRALITADTSCAHELLDKAEAPPFLAVPPGDPVALADAIRALTHNPQQRHCLATASRAYYDMHLRSCISIRFLEELLER